MLKFSDFGDKKSKDNLKLSENVNLDPTNSKIDKEILDKQTNKNQLDKEKQVNTKTDVKKMKKNYKEEIKNNPDDQVDIASNEKVATFLGKIINFIPNIQPQKAMLFLNENKISPNNFWYYLIEKNNELHVVKYNENKGVDIRFFIENLITYYLKNNLLNENIKEMNVAGNQNFVVIKNIPVLTQKTMKNDILKLLSDETFQM